MSSELRERRMQERAHRIAKRIHAERRAGTAAHYPSADAMCPPVASGAWKVPEPSRAAMEHMASFGYVEAAAEPTACAQTVQPARTAPPVPDERSFAQAVASGVQRALLALGIQQPQLTNPPPRNEDK